MLVWRAADDPGICRVFHILQRAYDQPHPRRRAAKSLKGDSGNRPRGGVVGEDGRTHQGVFDVAFLLRHPAFTSMRRRITANFRTTSDTR